jgi:hypothetical protein
MVAAGDALQSQLYFLSLNNYCAIEMESTIHRSLAHLRSCDHVFPQEDNAARSESPEPTLLQVHTLSLKRHLSLL